MIVVKIELWPLGNQAKARTLGVVNIANDGTGDLEKGNYKVALSHAGKYFGKPGAYKSGEVKGFKRALSPYHLLLRALQACLLK